MNISEIRRLVKLVETSGINELEIEEEGSRIKIVKQAAGSGTLSAPQLEQISPAIQVSQPSPALAAETPVPAPVAENIHTLTSPMVGTFYRAASPEAPPYVNIGDRVNIGQVLCIVEAMKLMNEIESEVNGTVRGIEVENAQPVEFGQIMFTIKPD